MKQLRSEIEIDASPDDVWNVLVDFERYPAWNPYIERIDGRPELGTKLELRLQPPEGHGATLKPTVTELRPGEVLEWWGHVGFRGIFDGRHRFELRPTSTGVVLVQS